MERHQQITQLLAYGSYIDSTEHSIDIKNILHRILTDRKDYYFIKPKGDMITKQITKTYVMVQNTKQGQVDKTRHPNCGVSCKTQVNHMVRVHSLAT